MNAFIRLFNFKISTWRLQVKFSNSRKIVFRAWMTQNWKFCQFEKNTEILTILLASIELSTIAPIVIIDVTYLAWFNVSPFTFVWAGGVLGHGVPLSKCRYVQTFLFNPLVYNFSRSEIFLSGFYSVLFNLKWPWLVKWYILYNRFLTKASLIAHCLFRREKR